MSRIVRRSDGRYMAKRQVDGRRYVVYGRTEDECREKLAELERQLALGRPPVPGHLTVQDWLEAWYEAERPRWRLRTLQDYRSLLDRYVLPEIGQVRLARMHPARWQRFLNSLEGRKASQVYAILRRAGNVAVRWGWLPENPMARIVAPAYRPARRTLPDRHDLGRLFRFCLESDDWAALVVAFAMVSGLRLGEVAALERGDIDWDAGVVRVQRSGQWLAGRRWTVGPPKTETSQRVLVLGPLGRTVLERQRQRLARAGLESPLVFPRPNGLPLTYEYASAAVRRLCRKAGVPELRFHDLRHAAASLAILGGVPLTEVSSFLGHTSPTTTSSIYAHALRSDRVTAVLEQALVGEGG